VPAASSVNYLEEQEQVARNRVEPDITLENYRTNGANC